MRKVIAYLRVSTNKQDLENQKFGIERYVFKNGFHNVQYIEDEISTTQSWTKRKLAGTLDTLTSGDLILVSEISRVARSTLQALSFLQAAAEKGISVHIVKQNLVFDTSIQSRIIVTVLALVAEIERDFISSRTKEALARKKADGIKLGRPPGITYSSKMSRVHEQLINYLKKDISVTDIAKLLDVERKSVYNYMKRKNIKKPTTKEKTK